MVIFVAGDVFEKGQDVDENFLKQAHFVRINGFKSLRRHMCTVNTWKSSTYLLFQVKTTFGANKLTLKLKSH